MSLTLWTGFQNSQDLKSWFGNEELDWAQIGEPLVLSHFSNPLVFSVVRTQLNKTWQRIDAQKHELYFGSTGTFSFILKRDDSTLLPVYEIGTAPIKMMSVLGELAGCVVDLTQALGFVFVAFQNSEQPGSFDLTVRFPLLMNLGEVLRAFGLVRAGLEILAYTRGFQVTDLCWRELKVDGSLFDELERRLCT